MDTFTAINKSKRFTLLAFFVPPELDAPGDPSAVCAAIVAYREGGCLLAVPDSALPNAVLPAGEEDTFPGTIGPHMRVLSLIHI